jgi:hypothetical protein
MLLAVLVIGLSATFAIGALLSAGYAVRRAERVARARPECRIVAIRRERGLCPVCRMPLGDDPLYCLRCATPHHDECMDYLGRCATYGCRGAVGETTQTPDEWLAGELERDRRESARAA